MLSILEAYSIYNQIPMAEGDKLKITFIMVETNYYYEVMHFGLKNIWVTY